LALTWPLSSNRTIPNRPPDRNHALVLIRMRVAVRLDIRIRFQRIQQPLARRAVRRVAG